MMERKKDTKRSRKAEDEDGKKRKALEDMKNPKNAKQLKEETVLCKPASSQSEGGSESSDTVTLFYPNGLYFEIGVTIPCAIGGNCPL